MQQELNRIMNKDLSKLDERLFGGLEKLESIDSTIQNLGEFQQFLLQQITQFEQKSKEKNHDRQVTQVIEQNCMTLRQSILKAVPQIQQSTSRLRQSILSPVNGFRSTGFNKWKGQNPQQLKTPELTCKIMSRKISQSHLELKQSKDLLIYPKIESLSKQLKELKDQHQKLKQQNQQVKKCIKEQFQARLATQFSKITDEIIKLKQQIQDLKLVIQKLSVQNAAQQLKHTMKNQIIFSSTHNPFTTNHQPIQSTQQEQPKQYKSFMDKMKSDFSTKIMKLSTLDNTRQSSPFKQTSNAKGNIMQDYKKSSEQSFHSVQLTREQILREKDVNVPKLLRRNSIVNEPHTSNCVSQQSSAFKTKQPIQELYNQHIFAHSSHTKPKSILEDQNLNQPSHSSSKKSNHDLMRKPKNNFFQNPLSNQQNTAPFFNPSAKIQFNDRNSGKSPIQTSNPTNLARKRSQSKQKLKIFSIL